MTSESEPNAEPAPFTPTRRLRDRVAGLPRTDTGWAAEHIRTKQTEPHEPRDEASQTSTEADDSG